MGYTEYIGNFAEHSKLKIRPHKARQCLEIQTNVILNQNHTKKEHQALQMKTNITNTHKFKKQISGVMTATI